MSVPNILLVSGTGRNTGKTTFSCGIIGKFRKMAIVAIKISPHFHPMPGYASIEEDSGNYQIFAEDRHNTGKDSSRMLDAGAAAVYYVQAMAHAQKDAFEKLLPLLPPGRPVVCESGGLKEFIVPGFHVLMTSDDTTNTDKKYSTDPHLVVRFSPGRELLPIEKMEFLNGRWKYTNEIQTQ